jgi:hypothetical protein
VLYYNQQKVKKKIGTVSTDLGIADSDVADLHISGDGSTFFKWSKALDSLKMSWFRWGKPSANATTLDWVPMGGLTPDGQYKESEFMGCSYDGRYTCCAFWWGSGFLEIFMISDVAPDWSSSIFASSDYTANNKPYFVMIGDVIYCALGKTIYSVRGVNHTVIKTTLAVCSGIWTDGSAIWVAAGDMTYMSTNQGWTWLEQIGVRAVNQGLYVRPASNLLDLVKTDPTGFQDDVQYPLKLNNRGLLSSFDGAWQNAFELKNGDDAFTVIDCDTRYATSPNGLFVLDNNMEGPVVLYFNVWRTTPFTTWRTIPANLQLACPSYSQYCQLLQDDNCIVGIPPIGGGDDGKDPGDDEPPPSTTPTPDPPKKPLPIGLIIGAVALGLLLIIGVIWVATRKQKVS